MFFVQGGEVSLANGTAPNFSIIPPPHSYTRESLELRVKTWLETNMNHFTPECSTSRLYSLTCCLLQVVRGSIMEDRERVLKSSKAMGFLTGYESKVAITLGVKSPCSLPLHVYSGSTCVCKAGSGLARHVIRVPYMYKIHVHV